MEARLIPFSEFRTLAPARSVPGADPQQIRPLQPGLPDELQVRREQLLDMQQRWNRVIDGSPRQEAAPAAAPEQAPIPPLNQMGDDQRARFEGQPASSLTEEQYKQLFGGDGWKLKDLADHRSNLTVGDLTRLKDDPEGLETVRDMMTQRPDLEMSDLVKKGRNGQTMVDPSLYDEPSKKLLLNRTDLKPLELTHMGASFGSWLKNPALAKESYNDAIDLMQSRSGIRPRELEQMMGSMIMSVGGNGSAQSAQGGAAVVDMFKSGTQLLKVRGDIQPHEVGKMATEVGRLAGKEAKDEGPRLVAQAFRAGSQTLQRAPHVGVNDVISTAKVMRKHFAGEDGKATEDRVHAFETGLDLMADHPSIKPDHIDQMLTRAKAQQPGLQGAKLLNAFDGMSHGLHTGSARLETLTDIRQPKGAPGDLNIDRFGHTETVRPDQRRPAPSRVGRPGGEGQVEPTRLGSMPRRVF